MHPNLTQETRPTHETGGEANLRPTMPGPNISRSSLRSSLNRRDIVPSYCLVGTKPTLLSNPLMVDDYCDGVGQKDQTENKHWNQCSVQTRLFFACQCVGYGESGKSGKKN